MKMQPLLRKNRLWGKLDVILAATKNRNSRNKDLTEEQQKAMIMTGIEEWCRPCGVWQPCQEQCGAPVDRVRPWLLGARVRWVSVRVDRRRRMCHVCRAAASGSLSLRFGHGSGVG